MIIEAVDKTESTIALHCVLSAGFLEQYIDIHNPKLIKSDVHNAVIDVCINHWGEFRKVPGKLFNQIIENEYEQGVIEGDEYDLLVGFGKTINWSTEVDVDYHIAKATEYLKEKYNEDFVSKLKDTEDDEYEQELSKYAPPTKEESVGIFPFEDSAAIEEAGKTVERKQLIKFPGALGSLLNRHFVSAAFVCLFAPAKRGKSWWLAYIKQRALFSGQGVWYISISDMLQDEVLSRMGHMNSGLPVHKEDLGIHWSPIVDCIHNQTGECSEPCEEMVLSDAKSEPTLGPENVPDYKVCKDHCDKFKGTVWYKKMELKNIMDAPELVNSWKKYKKRVKNKKLRIFTAHAGEFGIHTLEKWWNQQQREVESESSSVNWMPTTIVIDYLDLGEDDQKHYDDRSRLNKVFMKANAFAKKYDVLFVTASQTNAEGLTVELVTEENFSGDKRKLDHITAAIGLNQTPNEKARGIMRLNVFMGRHAYFNKLKTVKVIQDLKLGKVCKTSYH